MSESDEFLALGHFNSITIRINRETERIIVHQRELKMKEGMIHREKIDILRTNFLEVLENIVIKSIASINTGSYGRYYTTLNSKYWQSTSNHYQWNNFACSINFMCVVNYPKYDFSKIDKILNESDIILTSVVNPMGFAGENDRLTENIYMCVFEISKYVDIFDKPRDLINAINELIQEHVDFNELNYTIICQSYTNTEYYNDTIAHGFFACLVFTKKAVPTKSKKKQKLLRLLIGATDYKITHLFEFAFGFLTNAKHLP